MFAEPRKPRQYDQPERFYSNSYDSFLRSGNHNLTLPEGGNEGYTRLQVIGSPQLNQDQLWKLFDIVPGKKNLCVKKLIILAVKVIVDLEVSLLS